MNYLVAKHTAGDPSHVWPKPDTGPEVGSVIKSVSGALCNGLTVLRPGVQCECQLISSSWLEAKRDTGGEVKNDARSELELVELQA